MSEMFAWPRASPRARQIRSLNAAPRCTVAAMRARARCSPHKARCTLRCT